MNYNKILEQVSKEQGIPIEVVKKAYESYWEFIKKTIQDLPLKEDITEEQFNELRTNFNIPSLGKLSCTYDRMIGVKKRFKHLKKITQNDNNKEN